MLCTSSVPGSTFSVLHYPCLQSSVRSCNGHHCQNQQRLPLGKPSSVLRFYTSGGLLHHHECNEAADEVIGSVDTDELAKYFSFKSDPEDEGAEKMKKKMETARDQLAEALYQKGLAMAEIESMK
ncbi:Tripeptidyl-peptidase 2, partial [Camellia lanceoleosa]